MKSRIPLSGISSAAVLRLTRLIIEREDDSREGLDLQIVGKAGLKPEPV